MQPLPTTSYQSGWVQEMSADLEKAAVNPALADGLNYGPSRGHVQTRYAQLIGMPREYGYGASMGAWIIDYLTNWCGEWGYVVHSNMQYRAPAFSGDITYLNGEVVALDHDRNGGPIATVKVTMTNQDDVVMAAGKAEIELPTP